MGKEFVKKSTAERLHHLMAVKGLRQVDVLELCKPYCKKYGIEIRKSDLSQYCSGKNLPNQYRLTILSLALGVSEPYLMGYDVSPSLKSSFPQDVGALAADNSMSYGSKDNLSAHEREHMAKYRRLVEDDRHKVDDFTDALLLTHEQKKKAASSERTAM